MDTTADRDEDLLRAASMYYLQDLKMDVIARHLGTSRSTVSRLIKKARQTGLVEITLRPATSRAPGLARSLASAFGVQVYVVPVAESAGAAERLEAVAQSTARLLASWVDSDMVLGLAWGTTISAISRYLSTKPTRGTVVVQLNGAANTRTGSEYAAEIVGAFADAFTASSLHFPVPAFFDFPETRRAMWRERSIRRVLDAQARCDVALFSVGAVTGTVPSHVYSAGYLDTADLETLEEHEVVGDVCTVFLRADGSWRDIPLNARATGPSPSELAGIRRRVCAVAGENKVVPLLAALRAGVVTDLVLDEATAMNLLRAHTAGVGHVGASRPGPRPVARPFAARGHDVAARPARENPRAGRPSGPTTVVP